MKPMEQSSGTAAVVGVGSSDQDVLVGVGELSLDKAEAEDKGTSNMNGSP
jgi:hypothetical protein